MSRLDVLAELRETRPAAPAALRGRVLELAAAAAPPRRRLTWRRAAVVLLPAVLAVAAAAVVVAGRHGTTAPAPAPTPERGAAVGGGATAPAQTTSHARAGFDRPAAPVPPSLTRLQDYDATLSLRVRSAAALSDATKRAVRVARSLGGFETAVNVDVRGGNGDATLRLRVPVGHVADAVERLSALGTITGESVAVRDVQAGVDALDRELARLQRQLRELRSQPQADATTRRIAALTARVQRLQRGRAATVRTARLATISLALTTRAPAAKPGPAHHGPLHGAFVALRWLGIGALYALIVGGPVALLLAGLRLGRRGLRHRGERRLLERA